MHDEREHYFLLNTSFNLHEVLTLPQDVFFTRLIWQIPSAIILRFKNCSFCEVFLKISGFMRARAVSYLTLNGHCSKCWQKQVLELWINDNYSRFKSLLVFINVFGWNKGSYPLRKPPVSIQNSAWSDIFKTQLSLSYSSKTQIHIWTILDSWEMLCLESLKWHKWFLSSCAFAGWIFFKFQVLF